MNAKDREAAMDIPSFVFLDDAKVPFCVVSAADTDGEKMLCWWHPDKKWVSLRKVASFLELSNFYLRKIPDDQAALYDDVLEKMR